MREPPYSVGQDSANDNNANDSYPGLDQSIRDSYAAKSSATNKNSLYDSYIRAFRWAILRLLDRDVIAFVSNGGWIDGNTADGMRKVLAEEFSDIYIFNLRGNARTAGEQRQREKGNVFGSGSKATVAITVLVRDPSHVRPAQIHYTDVGDYLTREQKLERVAEVSSLTDLESTTIRPTRQGDWINQRRDDFNAFAALGDKQGGQVIFGLFSAGLQTNRDVWYGPTNRDLVKRVAGFIERYNAEVDRWQHEEMSGDDKVAQSWVDAEPTRLSWSRSLRNDLRRGRRTTFDDEHLTAAMYR